MMRVLLTGASGFIGSNVLQALRAAGHSVTAIVRSAHAERAAIRGGAASIRGDLAHAPWGAILPAFDGVIHLAAAPSSAAADTDRAFAQAVADAFAGTDKVFVHTGSMWMLGAGHALTDTTMLRPHPMWAWCMDAHELLHVAGVHVMTILPGIVYGQRRGLPNVLISHAPRTRHGAIKLVGDGSQSWATVHVTDLADLYIRVFTEGQPGSFHFGATTARHTVDELCHAQSRHAALAFGPEATSEDDVIDRFGEELGTGLLLDQRLATAQAGWDEVAWRPRAPTLRDCIAAGEYPLAPSPRRSAIGAKDPNPVLIQIDAKRDTWYI